MSYLCKFSTKWHQILYASLSNNPKVACRKQFILSCFNLEQTGTFVTSLIYDKRHFELSTGDVIMNIAVLFSLHFAENMLNMS